MQSYAFTILDTPEYRSQHLFVASKKTESRFTLRFDENTAPSGLQYNRDRWIGIFF